MTDKRRLVFDLPTPEYDRFKQGAQRRQMTAIDYFREAWRHFEGTASEMGKGITTEPKGRLDQVREQYLTLAASILNILNAPQSGYASLAVAVETAEKWDKWVNRLDEVVAILKCLPAPGYEGDHDRLGLPEPPVWIKTGRGAR